MYKHSEEKNGGISFFTFIFRFFIFPSKLKSHAWIIVSFPLLLRPFPFLPPRLEGNLRAFLSLPFLIAWFFSVLLLFRLFCHESFSSVTATAAYFSPSIHSFIRLFPYFLCLSICHWSLLFFFFIDISYSSFSRCPSPCLPIHHIAAIFSTSPTFRTFFSAHKFPP